MSTPQPSVRDRFATVQAGLQGLRFRLAQILLVLWRTAWFKPTPTLRPYSRHNTRRWQRWAPWVLVPTFIVFCFAYGFFYALTAPYLILQLSFPIIILGLLAIWSLPDTRRGVPTNVLQVLYFAFFVGLVVWPNYLALSLKGLPWITAIRLTGFPLVLTLLICTSASPKFREDMAKVLNATPLIWKFLTAFAVIQLLCIALSNNIPASINKFIIAQVSWTAIFFTSCYVFLKQGRPQIWALLFWFAILVVAGVGAYEYTLGRVPWAGHVPSFLKIEDEVVQRILSGTVRHAIGVHRVQSVFTTSLGLAECIALAVPFILHFVAGRYPLLLRASAAASLPFLFWVVTVTDSRLGMVGFFLAFLIYLLLWAALRWRRSRGSLVGPAIVLSYPAIFCAFIVATLFVGRLRNMVWGTGAHQASNEGRLRQYEEGIKKILSAPFGHGTGQGAETLGVRNAAGVMTIDTYYVLIALEYGIIGFFLYYGMVLSSIFYGGREIVRTSLDHDRDLGILLPATISLTSFFVIKSIFSNADNHPIAFMIMGLIAALTYRSQQASKSK